MSHRIVYAMATVLVLLLIGTVYFNQNESWSMIDSFYFSTMTLTTVGYGDLVPTTNASRVFVSFYSLFGIGVMIYVLGFIIGKIMIEQEKVLSGFFSKIPNLRKVYLNKKLNKKEVAKKVKKKK